MEEEDEAILKLLDTLDSYISAMASLTSSLRQVRFRYTFFLFISKFLFYKCYLLFSAYAVLSIISSSKKYPSAGKKYGMEVS